MAATAIFQRLGVPARVVTILEGESLINDASSLIAYRAAIAVVATGAFSLAETTGQFVIVAAGGIGSGRAMAAALAAGAEAVRVGTRFIAAEESEYHPTHVDKVVEARGEDAVLTEAFSVLWPDAPHRAELVHRGG